jgi:hypothetical protein
MFDIFRTKIRHRAARRSFDAFKATWIGPPFAKYIEDNKEAWSERYHITLNACKTRDAIDFLNTIIDFEMRHFIEGATIVVNNTYENRNCRSRRK